MHACGVTPYGAPHVLGSYLVCHYASSRQKRKQKEPFVVQRPAFISAGTALNRPNPILFASPRVRAQRAGSTRAPASSAYGHTRSRSEFLVAPSPFQQVVRILKGMHQKTKAIARIGDFFVLSSLLVFVVTVMYDPLVPTTFLPLPPLLYFVVFCTFPQYQYPQVILLSLQL